jgi:hypothetical protein
MKITKLSQFSKGCLSQETVENSFNVQTEIFNAIYEKISPADFPLGFSFF